MSFCAICTDDIVGEPRREPLGKNDALVDVCIDCATQTVRHVDGVERGYEPNGGLPTAKAANAGARRVVSESQWAADTKRILQEQRGPSKVSSGIVADSQVTPRRNRGRK